MDTEKKKKPKKGFLDGYKRYDPVKDGYGDPSQWQQAFQERMGLDKAKQVLKDKNPYIVLGIHENATWDEIKSAYRKMVMKWHPDRCVGDENASANFQAVQAAYEVLADKIGK